MATQVQFRRGTTAQNASFTGALGEVTVDTDKDTLVVHDGGTAGGFEISRADASNLKFPDGAVGTPAISFASDTNTGIYRGGTDILKFVTAGTDAVTIDANQRLGIGTSSPSTLLHTQGGRVRFDANSENFALQLNNSTTANGPFLGSAGADTFVVSASSGAERMRITSAGNVGIGTSIPQQLINIESTSNAKIRYAYSSAIYGEFGRKPNGVHEWSSYENGASLTFGTSQVNGSTTERMRIDSSGNVGIGTSSPNEKLTINSGALSFLGDISTPSIGAGLFRPANNTLAFVTGSTEAMRIDSNGKVLVGMSVSSGSSDGIQLIQDGRIFSTVDGQLCTILNRKTSDGGIIEFRKDGTTVGSIGVDNSDNLFIQGNSTHVGFQFASSAVVPHKNGATIDNNVNLGSASDRFKDLYLSGGVYLGGTGSANYLDSYEEGTWSPALEDYGGTPTFTDAHFTKIGRVVHASVRVLLDGSSDPSGFKISGLPFTSLNTNNSLFGGYVSYTSSTFTNNIYVFVNSNDTDIRLYTTSGNSVSYNDIGASKEIRLVAIYFTA